MNICNESLQVTQFPSCRNLIYTHLKDEITFGNTAPNMFSILHTYSAIKRLRCVLIKLPV